MATPSAASVDLARQARRAALVGLLPAGGPGVGMARPAVLRAEGPDAARWLHSQTTNDVEGLQPGAGSLGARVARTGHVEAIFSLHRDPVAPERFRLILPADEVEALRAGLDAFLFADDVTLSVEPDTDWVAVQGPTAPGLLEAVFGPLGFEPWSALPEGALRPVRRARKDAGFTPPDGAWVVRRSITGDAGFLLAFPAGTDLGPLADAFRAQGADVVDAAAFSDAVEVLRVEAGLPRLGPDTAGKRRLLPETGVEQQAVSYTKGCYLGQEVIARVRTYGSVPTLLRALVLPKGLDAGALAAVPEPGADVVTAEGKKVGTFASRTWSPVLGAPVVLAYLDRASRTPGTRLSLVGVDRTIEAEVAALPLYSAPDTAARVQQLYDRAIRTFADGEEDAALGLLEEALRLDPGFGDAYEAVGVILGRAGRFHEAIDVFRRLEEVAPDEPMVNTNLSLYYMKLGDKETAEDESGKATLKGMAKARGKTGAGATADEDLEKAKRKDAERKRGMFAKVLEFDPDDPIALFGIGQALLTLGDAEGAERYLAHAVEVDKNNSPVWAARGKALERLGRIPEAVAVYKEGVACASRKGDLMPLREMEHRLLLLGGR
jgi:folate-binding protein YgfZ